MCIRDSVISIHRFPPDCKVILLRNRAFRVVQDFRQQIAVQPALRNPTLVVVGIVVIRTVAVRRALQIAVVRRVGEAVQRAAANTDGTAVAERVIGKSIGKSVVLNAAQPLVRVVCILNRAAAADHSGQQPRIVRVGIIRHVSVRIRHAVRQAAQGGNIVISGVAALVGFLEDVYKRQS